MSSASEGTVGEVADPAKEAKAGDSDERGVLPKTSESLGENGSMTEETYASLSNAGGKTDEAAEENGGGLAAILSDLGSGPPEEPGTPGKDKPKAEEEAVSSPAKKSPGFLEMVGGGVLSLVGLGSPRAPADSSESSTSHEPETGEGEISKEPSKEPSKEQSKEQSKEPESTDMKPVEDIPKAVAEEFREKDEPGMTGEGKDSAPETRETGPMPTGTEETKKDEQPEKELGKPGSFFGVVLKHVDGSGEPSEEIPPREKEESNVAPSSMDHGESREAVHSPEAVKEETEGAVLPNSSGAEEETNTSDTPREPSISDKGDETKVASEAEDTTKEMPMMSRSMEKAAGESEGPKSSAGDEASEKEVPSMPEKEKAPSEDDGMRASEPIQTSERELPAMEEKSEVPKPVSEEKPEGSTHAATMGEGKETKAEEDGHTLEKQPSLSLFIPKQDEETSVTEQSTPTMPRGPEESEAATPRATPSRQPAPQVEEKHHPSPVHGELTPPVNTKADSRPVEVQARQWSAPAQGSEKPSSQKTSEEAHFERKPEERATDSGTQKDAGMAAVPLGTDTKSQSKSGIAKFIACFKGCVGKKGQAV